MASEDTEVEIRPGFFHLQLNLFKDIPMDHMQARIDNCIQKMKKEDMITANCNLLGILYYKAKKMKKALDQFQDIIKRDPTNLNALEHSKALYSRLYRNKDAQRCQAVISDIMGKKDHPEILALCLAEQAFAISFEVYDDHKNESRYKLSNEYFLKAIEYVLTAKVVDDNLVAQWYFLLGRNYRKVYDISFRKNLSCEQLCKHFSDCIQFFHKATLKSEKMLFQSKAWGYLGSVLSFKPLALSAEIPDYILQNNLTRFYDDPSECFKKAKDLDPNNENAIVQHSRHLLHMRKHKEAKQLIDEIISRQENRNEATDWFTFKTRALICRKWYETQRKERGKELMEASYGKKAARGDKDLLVRAKADLEKSIELNNNAVDLALLGVICHYLAKDFKVVEIEEALSYFLDAVLYLDGDKMSDVHYQYGMCLLEYGEKRPAAECFKRAMENDSHQSNWTSPFYQLVSTLFILYKELQEDDEAVSILGEISYVVNDGLAHYKEDNLKTSLKFIAVYNCEDMIKLIQHMTKESKHTSALMCIDAMLMLKGEKFQVYEKGLHDMRELCNQQNLECSMERSEITLSIHNDSNQQQMSEDFQDMKLSDMAMVQDNSPSDSGFASLLPSACSKTVPQNSRIPKGIGNAKNKHDKKYDFFVSFSNKDKDWVYYSLLRKLEDNHQFKGCIHERDFLPGKEVHDNILEAIKMSSCTLAILTPDFSGSTWCKQELQKAIFQSLKSHDSKHVVIPIQLSECKVPDCVESITRLEAYKDPIESFRWERLINALDIYTQ